MNGIEKFPNVIKRQEIIQGFNETFEPYFKKIKGLFGLSKT